MKCPRYGHENKEEAGFCGGCGQSLVTEKAYPQCEHPNPQDNKFCDNSGHRLIEQVSHCRSVMRNIFNLSTTFTIVLILAFSVVSCSKKPESITRLGLLERGQVQSAFTSIAAPSLSSSQTSNTTAEQNGAPVAWLSFFVDLVRALAWPVVILILISALVMGAKFRRRMAEFLRIFKSIKLWEAEFVISEAGAKEVAMDLKEAFADYRRQVIWEYDRQLGVNLLKEKLERVVEDHVKPYLIDSGDKLEFRCTIHIPDILFAETLYQLLDYYPKGGGRGRIWSTRFGIIGRVWRLGKSETLGNVPTREGALIGEWGMTREEASAAALGRRFFSCVVLRDEEDIALGIFYLDAAKENAFGTGDPQRLQDMILQGCKQCGLIKSLSDLSRELRKRGPLINIYE